MTREELAEELGYKKIRGFVATTNPHDIFYTELEMAKEQIKEYWYNEETQVWFDDLLKLVEHHIIKDSKE